MGIGTRTAAIQPSRVDAQSIPMPLNICSAKSGNPAAKQDRKSVFAAIAEAALGGSSAWCS